MAAAAGADRPLPVHVKVDTGMHRVGASPPDAARVALAVARPTRSCELEGLWTHFAVADEPESPYTAEQLARFLDVVDQLAGQGVRPTMLHAANSAGAAVPPGRPGWTWCGAASPSTDWLPRVMVAGRPPCAGCGRPCRSGPGCRS